MYSQPFHGSRMHDLMCEIDILSMFLCNIYKKVNVFNKDFISYIGHDVNMTFLSEFSRKLPVTEVQFFSHHLCNSSKGSGCADFQRSR